MEQLLSSFPVTPKPHAGGTAALISSARKRRAPPSKLELHGKKKQRRAAVLCFPAEKSLEAEKSVKSLEAEKSVKSLEAVKLSPVVSCSAKKSYVARRGRKSEAGSSEGKPHSSISVGTPRPNEDNTSDASSPVCSPICPPAPKRARNGCLALLARGLTRFDPALVRKAIDGGVDVNGPLRVGGPPVLLHAIDLRCPDEILEILIAEGGAEPNAVDSDGATALHLLAKSAAALESGTGSCGSCPGTGSCPTRSCPTRSCTRNCPSGEGRATTRKPLSSFPVISLKSLIDSTTTENASTCVEEETEKIEDYRTTAKLLIKLGANVSSEDLKKCVPSDYCPDLFVAF